MILIIDNYDSFTYNLVQLVGQVQKDIQKAMIMDLQKDIESDIQSDQEKNIQSDQEKDIQSDQVKDTQNDLEMNTQSDLEMDIQNNILTIRNDRITVEEIRKLKPSHIIISPGPGYPAQAGICEQVIMDMKRECPILGVCLGHQAICEAFGGRISRARHLMHGKQSSIMVANGNPIFYGLPPVIQAARYHSLIADVNSLPEELLVTAEDEVGEIMAVQHRDYDVYGLQFHPESILTPQGDRIIKNFLMLGYQSS